MDERLRPESSSRRSPASPGKRRMVDNEKGKVRLISRGLPDSDEEDVIINQPQVITAIPPPKDNRTLNLTNSRKRKTLDLKSNEQAVLVLPSPTTQIARQIDSIRLVGTPVYGHTNRLPMLGLAEPTTTAGTSRGFLHPSPHMDSAPHEDRSSGEGRTNLETSSPSHSTTKQDDDATNKMDMVKPTSPNCVPPIGTDIEISDDTVTMETYLQRPQHAMNMKRTLNEYDGKCDDANEEPDEREEDVRAAIGGRKEKIIKYMHSSSRSNSTTPPIRVSTIIQSPTKSVVSPPTTTSDSLLHNYNTQVPSSVGFIAVPVGMSTQAAVTPGASSLPSLSVPFSSVLPRTSSPSSSTVPNTSTPSPVSKPPPSKVSNFSISELLAKDDSKSKSPKPIPQPFTTTPVPPPNFLSLYYQQWYMQMLSNMKKFQGESAEVDSGPFRGGNPSSSASTSSLTILNQEKANHQSTTSASPTSNSNVTSPNTNESLQSPPPGSLISKSSSSSPGKDKVSQDGGNKSGTGVNPPRSSTVPTTTVGEDGPGSAAFNQRQNALLQVGEAHLAILPDEDGDTPLHLSIIQENIPLTFYLVRLISGVRMNLDIANNLRQTPLHLSVITRQPMLTQLLVQNEASVNFPDRRGNTCVHLAAQRKNLDALQILAQANSPIPDFNCRNFAGLTPVHIATKEGSVDVLKFLFQMGANKNCADSCSGRTPLHYAVESQNLQVCNYLLESGCNVNAITFSGNTPLHVAAGRRLKDIVAVLMAYGANPAIANGEGDFPSDLPASLLMQRAKMNTR